MVLVPAQDYTETPHLQPDASEPTVSRVGTELGYLAAVPTINCP